MRLLICLLLTSSPAAAIGLCEDLDDRAELMSISERQRQIAVRRTEERCRETEAGEEDRATLEYVEIRDLEGAVLARYGDKAVRDAYPQALPSAALGPALKAGAFSKRRASADNGRCALTTAVIDGALQVTIRGAKRAAPLLQQTILRDVDPAEKPAVRSWWIRTGSVVVLDVEATTLIDQGMLGTETGHASTVIVLRDPALRPCAYPIQRTPPRRSPAP